MAAPRNLLLVSDDHVPYRDDLRWTVLETIRRLSPAVLEDLGARSWPKPGPAIPRSAPSSRGQSNASRQTGSTTARSSPISPFPIPKNLTTRSRLHWRGRTVALEEYLRQAETHYNAWADHLKARFDFRLPAVFHQPELHAEWLVRFKFQRWTQQRIAESYSGRREAAHGKNGTERVSPTKPWHTRFDRLLKRSISRALAPTHAIPERNPRIGRLRRVGFRFQNRTFKI